MPVIFWILGLFGTGLFLLVILAILLMFSYVISYVLVALAIYGIAQKRSIQYPWLAWIPIANLYLLGQILRNELSITPQIKIPVIQIIMPLSFILMLLAGDTFLGSILSIIAYGLICLSMIALFRQYQEPNAIFFGLLAGLPWINIIGCFLLYPLINKPTPDPSADSTIFP